MIGEHNRVAAWAVVEVREKHFVVMLTKLARRGPQSWRLVSSHRSRYTAECAREKVAA